MRAKKSSARRGRGRPGGSARPLPPAPFVAKIVDDPANPPSVILVTGFPGASSVKGFHRIYLCRSLTRYIDVDPADIRHAIPAPGEKGEGGLVLAWIDGDAECWHGSSTMRPWHGKLATSFIQVGGATGSVIECDPADPSTGAPPPPTPLGTGSRPHCTCSGPACPGGSRICPEPQSVFCTVWPDCPMGGIPGMPGAGGNYR